MGPRFVSVGISLGGLDQAADWCWLLRKPLFFFRTYRIDGVSILFVADIAFPTHLGLLFMWVECMAVDKPRIVRPGIGIAVFLQVEAQVFVHTVDKQSHGMSNRVSFALRPDDAHER